MIFKDELSKLGVCFNEVMDDRFNKYYSKLVEVNEYMNLTSITEHDEVYNKHFYDSLTILKALGKPESLITYVKDRPGHDLRYAMDPTKIETELGWKPEHNFDTGIVATIQWNLDNQEWLSHVESGEYMNWIENNYNKR